MLKYSDVLASVASYQNVAPFSMPALIAAPSATIGNCIWTAHRRGLAPVVVGLRQNRSVLLIHATDAGGVVELVLAIGLNCCPVTLPPSQVPGAAGSTM